MKGIPKSRGLLVVALIVAMITAGGIPLTGTSYAADESIVESNGGSGLGKVAEPAGVNEWEITLTVDSSLKGRSSDIVIVMDRSRSMNSNQKIEKAKEAAISFVNQMLTSGSNTQIAVVTFDKTATTVHPFSAVKEDLINAIATIDANYPDTDKTVGGTNLQAGLYSAADLLKSYNPDIKSIVLIGDGAPTHSYEFSGSVYVDLSCEIVKGKHVPKWEIINIDSDYIYQEDHIIGFGNKFEITGPAFTVVSNCPQNDSLKHKFIYPDNHGIPAIYEASKLKNHGVKIYSIGIGVANDGKDVLKQCENAGYFDITTCDPTYDFSGVAAAISSESFNSVVTDPIGDEFSLVINDEDFDWAIEGQKEAETADVVISKGNDAEYDPVNAVITWDIGKLNSGETATMTYYVKARAGIIFEEGTDNLHQTNKATTIEYQYKSGNPFTSNFPIPKVPLTGGAVVLKAIAVDQDGNLIPSMGTAAEDYEGAELLEQGRFPKQGELPDIENEYMVYGDCQVSMGAISGYDYKGFTYIDSNGSVKESETDPSINTVNISLTQTNKAPTVYFKYYKGSNESEHYYDVTVKYVDENDVPIPGSENKTYKATEGAIVTETAKIFNEYSLIDEKTSPRKITVTNPAENLDANTIIFKYKKKSTDDTDGGGSGGGGGGGSSTTTTAGVISATLNKTDHFAYAIGYPDGLVRPLGTITREEVAVIFYRLLTDESRKAYAAITHPFNDVSSSRWSNNEIATLYNAKIIQGNDDGSFEPARPITRAEFATIAAKFDQLEVSVQNKFPDIENHWAKDYINSSAIKGWINGYGDGTFRPNYFIIRCEAMKLINEVLDRRVTIAGLHKDTRQWPDNTSDKWYYEIVLEATNTHDYDRADKPKSTETWTKIIKNPVW